MPVSGVWVPKPQGLNPTHHPELGKSLKVLASPIITPNPTMCRIPAFWVVFKSFFGGRFPS